MGHFYGMAAACERWNMRGEQLQYHFLSLLVPILIHGFYDFAATADSAMLDVAFFAFVIALDIIAIQSVKKYSREDAPL